MVSADPTLLFVGIGLLAVGMYALGGKHQPRRAERRRKRAHAKAKSLRARAAKLEREAA